MKKLVVLLLVFCIAALPAFAQKSFDMRYSEAVEYYTAKNYDMAIKTLEAAKKAPGATKDQKAKADQLIRQCRAALTKMADLNLSKETIIAPGGGMRDSIYVTAGKKWNVTSKPDWCSTTVESDVVFITIAPNPDKEPRKGVIEISMGKERTAYVLVNQEEKRDVKHVVTIRTVPERSIIYIDDNTGVLSDQFTITEGTHHVRIEKNGFEKIDTVLFVPKNAKPTDLYHRIEMVPTFALLSVNIEPEDGLFFDSAATLDISGNVVNLHPSSLKSFNVDQEVSYYNLYEDDVIPLHPGKYVIRAESPGFTPEVVHLAIEKGETKHLDFKLTALYGILIVNDEENAVGAKILIDEKPLGSVPSSGKVKTGHHVLRFEKPGYVSEQKTYEVDIVEGKESEVNVSMKRYGTYSFTSDPAYCKVYVDGEALGTTPLQVVMTEGEHELRFEKTGYYPITQTLDTKIAADNQEYKIHLDKTYPLTVTSDVDSLQIVISKGSGQNRVVYVDNVKTPATVELPASKTMYKVQLLRSNLKKAYNGYFWFGGKRKRLNLTSYSNENFRFIGANYYLLKPNKFTVAGKDFRRIADVSLAELSVVPGLTTNVIKATAFWQTDDTQTLNVANSDIQNMPKMFLPAISVLFINGEFRLGGGLRNEVDFDLLGTYAWYPNVSSFIPFSHMSGHDVFLGGEISSRFPFVNLNFKAGLQVFYGQANICGPTTKSNVKDRFYHESYTVPFNNAEFVVTVGIKLGGKDSKGNNILRVF
ncbi:MAG: PEGA domain-containing protein [Bacteroidales bacterium]|nr:PEGA domain-containing protein [Bacteroidales bacterium]